VIADEARLPDRLKLALAGTGGRQAPAGAEALVEAARDGVRTGRWRRSSAVPAFRPLAALEGGKTLRSPTRKRWCPQANADDGGARALAQRYCRSIQSITPFSSASPVVASIRSAQDHPDGKRRALPHIFARRDARGHAGAGGRASQLGSMGAKISVDSATMMNKGLELIEAHTCSPSGSTGSRSSSTAVGDPQPMVEYVDRSTLAQLGSPDMRIPIAHALAWPQRMDDAVRAARPRLHRRGSTFDRAGRGAFSRA
jgi:1-deoxy-D-xylulose-5-phosphate reductoisomerase